MATTIQRRVAALEESTAGGCPECGFDGDHSKIRHEVVFVDIGAPTPPDEYCGTCGRALSVTIALDWGAQR